MAFDAARGEMVLFGGLSSAGQLGDTWLFGAGGWESAHPAVSPPPRLGASIAFDEARERIVMFGGHSGSSRLNETWVWDGTTWSQLTPAVAPSPRSFAAMAYDSARDELLLFGGIPAGGGTLADTWTFDGTTWTQRNPMVSPPFRDSASMTYDPIRQQVVLFGGYGQGGPLADTWVWDGSSWQQRSPTTSPPRRSSAGMAHDPQRDRVVLFGGIDNVGYRNDTWAWDGSTWSEATPPTSPPRRASMGLAWGQGIEEIVMFGGSSANLDRNDTWTWNGSEWTSRDPVIPEARHSAVAAEGPGGRAVMFGGMTDAGLVDETWTWDGVWVQADPTVSPPGRTIAAAAFDSIRDELVMFGGMGAGGAELGDTWVWDGQTWTQRETLVAPPARHNHVMAYDAERRQIVLFGGSNGDLGVVFSDTWVWDGDEWSLRDPATSPPPLSAAAMAYDAGHESTVMFGGYDQNVQRTDGTWIWNGFSWSQAQPETDPIPRAGGHLSYDPNLAAPILFGGNEDLGKHLGDAWAWDGTDWLPLELPGPPERWGAAFAYSSAAKATVVYGGNRNTYLDDTWVFRSLRRIGPDPVLELDSRAFEGPFWFVYGVSVEQDGAGASFEIEPTSVNARSVAYGLYAVRAEDLSSLSFFVGTGDSTATDVLVDDDANGVHQRLEPEGGVNGATSGFMTTFDDLDRGEYHLVVVNTAPSAGTASVRLFGDSDVELVATSQGAAGGLARETDFEAPRNVQVRSGAGPVKAHAGMIEDGRLAVGIEHRLFGIFQSLGADPNDVSYVAPDEQERTGQTTYVLVGKAPGAYTFKVNEWRAAHAGFGSAGYVALLTADVALPPIP